MLTEINSANIISCEIKNDNNPIVVNESMFVLPTLEKTKETRLKFSQGSVKVL